MNVSVHRGGSANTGRSGTRGGGNMKMRSSSSCCGTRSGGGRGSHLLALGTLLRVGLCAFSLTLEFLFRFCLHVHCALHGLDTRLLLLELIERPLLLHELSITLTQRAPGLSRLEWWLVIAVEYGVDIGRRGELKIRAGVEADAGAIEKGDEREVAQRAVVKVVLLVFARALARRAAFCLRRRLARIDGRSQRAEIVEVAKGDALALPVDEEGDFGVRECGEGAHGRGAGRIGPATVAAAWSAATVGHIFDRGRLFGRGGRGDGVGGLAGVVHEGDHLFGLGVLERLEVLLAFEFDRDALALDVRRVVRVALGTLAQRGEGYVQPYDVAGAEGAAVGTRAREGDLLTRLVPHAVRVPVEAAWPAQRRLAPAPAETDVRALALARAVGHAAGAASAASVLDRDLHVPASLTNGCVAARGAEALFAQQAEAVLGHFDERAAVLPAHAVRARRALDRAEGVRGAFGGEARGHVAEAEAVVRELVGVVVG